ncbi:2,3-bisphosphoglycerate-independent phosphoglycerate mutase, partial [Aeromonas veronii]
LLDEETGQAHSAHTNLPFPLIYFGRKDEVVEGGKLSDLAPSMLTLMGLPVTPDMTGMPLMILI